MGALRALVRVDRQPRALAGSAAERQGHRRPQRSPSGESRRHQARAADLHHARRLRDGHRRIAVQVDAHGQRAGQRLRQDARADRRLEQHRFVSPQEEASNSQDLWIGVSRGLLLTS